MFICFSRICAFTIKHLLPQHEDGTTVIPWWDGFTLKKTWTGLTRDYFWSSLFLLRFLSNLSSINTSFHFTTVLYCGTGCCPREKNQLSGRLRCCALANPLWLAASAMEHIPHSKMTALGKDALLVSHCYIWAFGRQWAMSVTHSRIKN